MRKGLYALAALAVLGLASGVAGSDSRTARQEKLEPFVGVWETRHELPAREGEPTIVKGQATIEWDVGDAWLVHEFRAEFPGRGDVFVKMLMNYSPSKSKYNLYLFDHFGGEAGVFYGDWAEDGSMVLDAEFEEGDGSTSYQRFVLTPVSDDEFWFSRAFSDDGNEYHFALKGVYTRKGG